MRKIFFIVVTATLMIIVLLIFSSNYLKLDNETNNTLKINSTTPTLLNNISVYSDYSESIPSSDKIYNSIDWSKYPNIGYHFIHELRVAGPNSLINHTFLLVTMRIEIKNPDDVIGVYNDMSKIIKEQRTALGPNSDPELRGEVNGVVVFRAGMLPYSNQIYREDYYHPVNNLTWSDIDVSEVN